MKIRIALIMLGILLCFTACGKSTPAMGSDPASAGENTQIGNPWRDITEEEAKELCPHSVKVPAEAENVQWSVLPASDDAAGTPGALVQLVFDLNGNTFTAREQVTGKEETDTAGWNYDWTAQEAMTIPDGNGGKIEGRCYRYIGEDEYVDLCTWYDAQTGVSYSLGVTAKDLDGFDLQAIVEQIFP